jgi:hypothetical protein
MVLMTEMRALQITKKPAGLKLRTVVVIALVLVIMAGAVAVPALAGSGQSTCDEKCGTCDGLTEGTWDWYWCEVFQNACHNFTWDCLFP